MSSPPLSSLASIETLAPLAFVLSLASAWYLCGLIWLVQIVQYPGLARIAPERFAEQYSTYVKRISFVVGPPMLIEVASVLFLLEWRPAFVSESDAWLAVALVVVVWLSTALFQVPAHGKLARGFDERVIRRLVATNWIRTLAWTARALASGWCAWKALGAP